MPIETDRPVRSASLSRTVSIPSSTSEWVSWLTVVPLFGSVWGVVDRGAGFALAHGVGGGGVRGILVCISSHIRRGGEWVD
jgi:hypothetical protein